MNNQNYRKQYEIWKHKTNNDIILLDNLFVVNGFYRMTKEYRDENYDFIRLTPFYDLNIDYNVIINDYYNTNRESELNLLYQHYKAQFELLQSANCFIGGHNRETFIDLLLKEIAERFIQIMEEVK